MSDQNAWMPLYVGDYLADTMHLTGPEHGAYLLLLMHAWRSGPLPGDERKLAAIARTDLKAWREMCETILAFFTWTDDGLVQGRLERIRSEQGAKIEQRRAAGKASAEARKAQRKSNDRSTTVEAPLPPRATEPEPEPEIPSSLRSSGAPQAASRRGIRLPDDWLPQAAEHALAVELGLDLLRDVLPRFRDYWRSKPGAGGVKLDWNATLRNWLRSEAERRTGRGGKPVESVGDTIADLMADPMGRGREPPPPSFDFEGQAEEVPYAR